MRHSIQTKAFIALTLAIITVGIFTVVGVELVTSAMVQQYSAGLVEQDVIIRYDAENAGEVVPSSTKTSVAVDYITLQAMNLQDQLVLTTVIIAGAAILGLIVAAYFIVARFSRPIKELTKRVTEGQPTIPVKGSADEIQALSQSYNDMLNKLNGALSAQKHFNVSVAHELKTPLAVMRANLDVLNALDSTSMEDVKETMNIIAQNLFRMNTVIETLLDNSTLSTASLDDDVLLEEIVGDAVEDLKPLAKTKGITLSFNGTVCPSSKGNAVLLYRAMYNLIENAIKYNKPSGRVRVTLENEKDGVRITIADSGIGIPDKDLPHVFEPFYRSDRDQAEGLGLGLSLVLNIVQRHSGSVDVISRPGDGTVFTVTLPRLI
jgi:signal transduction histidine kinase